MPAAMMVRVWQHAVAAIFRGDTTSLSEASLRAELAASCKEVGERQVEMHVLVSPARLHSVSPVHGPVPRPRPTPNSASKAMQTTHLIAV